MPSLRQSGADEDTCDSVVAAQSSIPGGALLGSKLAGNASDLHFTEAGAQLRRDVFRSLDEAAER